MSLLSGNKAPAKSGASVRTNSNRGDPGRLDGAIRDHLRTGAARVSFVSTERGNAKNEPLKKSMPTDQSSVAAATRPGDQPSKALRSAAARTPAIAAGMRLTKNPAIHAALNPDLRWGEPVLFQSKHGPSAALPPPAPALQVNGHRRLADRFAIRRDCRGRRVRHHADLVHVRVLPGHRGARSRYSDRRGGEQPTDRSRMARHLSSS